MFTLYYVVIFTLLSLSGLTCSRFSVHNSNKYSLSGHILYLVRGILNFSASPKSTRLSLMAHFTLWKLLTLWKFCQELSDGRETPSCTPLLAKGSPYPRHWPGYLTTAARGGERWQLNCLLNILCLYHSLLRQHPDITGSLGS